MLHLDAEFVRICTLHADSEYNPILNLINEIVGMEPKVKSIQALDWFVDAFGTECLFTDTYSFFEIAHGFSNRKAIEWGVSKVGVEPMISGLISWNGYNDDISVWARRQFPALEEAIQKMHQI
jgi:hypothetical protein